MLSFRFGTVLLHAGIDDRELCTAEIRRTVDTMPIVQREILAALIVHLQRYFLIFIAYNMCPYSRSTPCTGMRSKPTDKKLNF